MDLKKKIIIIMQQDLHVVLVSLLLIYIAFVQVRVCMRACVLTHSQTN